jgi:hypothetical protein
LSFPSSRLRDEGMPSRIQRATWSRHATRSAVRSSSTRRRPKTGMSRVKTLPQRSRLFDDESFPSATFASNNDAAYSLQGGRDRIVPSTRS